jgi:hypothetical protein
MQHASRYLKGSMENEPELSWGTQMRGLVREMAPYRNSLGADEPPGICKAMDFDTRYTEILNTAKTEHEYDPPGKYHKDGYNLCAGMGKYKENHLLSPRGRRVPSNNNPSGRLLRILKRKQKQAITFRSFENLDYLCHCMGVLASLSSQNQNLFKNVTAILD